MISPLMLPPNPFCPFSHLPKTTNRPKEGTHRLSGSGHSHAPARAAVPAPAAVVATAGSAPAQQFRERRVVRGDVCVLRRQVSDLLFELLQAATAGQDHSGQGFGPAEFLGLFYLSGLNLIGKGGTS